MAGQSGSKSNAAKKLLKKAKNKSPRQSQRIASKQDVVDEKEKCARRQERHRSSGKNVSKGQKVPARGAERIVKDRSRKFEDSQLDLLLTLVFKKVHILEGNISNSENGITRELKHKMWESIATAGQQVGRYT